MDLQKRTKGLVRRQQSSVAREEIDVDVRRVVDLADKLRFGVDADSGERLRVQREESPKVLEILATRVESGPRRGPFTINVRADTFRGRHKKTFSVRKLWVEGRG